MKVSCTDVFCLMIFQALILSSESIAQDTSVVDVQQSALQYRVQQEAVLANTSQIADQIAQINLELKDNGASDLEIRDIDAVLKDIGHITKEDMAGVIASLQSAGDTTDEKKQATALSTAYQGQQTVLAKITVIAAKLQQKQTYERLEAEIQDLLQRQIGNIRLSTAVQKIGAMNSNEAWKARGDAIQVQIGLEPRLDALRPEIELLIEKLPPAESASLKKDIERVGFAGLAAIAQNAAEVAYGTAIDGSGKGYGGDWPQAIKSENAIKDQLSGLLALIAAKDPDSALEQASDALDRAIMEQQSLLDSSKANPDAKATADLANMQGTLQDKTAVLSTSLTTLAPNALAPLATASTAMDNSNQALTETKPKDSLDPQQKAIDALKLAKDNLQKEIASRAQQPDQGLDPEDQLSKAASALTAAANSNQQADGSLAQGSPEGQAEAMSKLGNSNENLDKATSTGGLPKDAQDAVNDAKKAIDQAKDGAGKGQISSARGSSKTAADLIAKAQEVVSKALASEAGSDGKSDGSGVGTGGLGETPLQSGSTKISASQNGGSMNIDYVHGKYGKAAEVTVQHLENREAIAQVPVESVPSEYSDMVSQYYKNLANSSAAR